MKGRKHMEVERMKQSGHVTYWIFSQHAGESVAFEPKELMQLLTWLQEHEDEIVNDALQNDVNEEMKGL